jgi:hypothetical protein
MSGYGLIEVQPSILLEVLRKSMNNLRIVTAPTKVRSEYFSTCLVDVCFSYSFVTCSIILVVFPRFLAFSFKITKRKYDLLIFFIIIWFVRLLALRPLLVYCASLG